MDTLTRALHDEFPELDATRLRAAVERAVARAANEALDTEGYAVVDLHLARVEATEESTERAEILRQLSDTLEQRGDADRALVVRLSAFAEAATAADLDPLLRLARISERWSELPLDAMNALVDPSDDASARRLGELATAWQHVGRAYYAADCLERVLVLAPADLHAHEALELFYRSTGEWPVLIDLLERRAVHVDDRERGELYREIGVIYERELGDDRGALDAYREADRLWPDHPDVVDALARLAARTGDDDALGALERWSAMVTEPIERARVLCRAADLARLQDYDKAQALYERARRDDPDLVPAIDGLAVLLRDRGQLAEAMELLVGAANRPALGAERSRWLADAADFCVALGDVARAKLLYRDARTTDPTNHHAGIALVELCWEAGALVELAPILDELCRTTDDPGRLRGYLLQRGKVAAQLGDATGARNALTLAVDLDPHDAGPRRELADLWFEVREWAKARPLLESLLEREDLLPIDDCIELHSRLARCAHELGDKEGAARQVAVTLALAPHHRAALLLRTELDAADPHALAADQLALANLAPAEEKAARFAALGDRYTELGDPATAREMYREALVYRPGDHPLLTKFLGLVAADGDWSYSLDIVERLIDTEADPAVRARYRHLAGMIARDELGNRELAASLLDRAIEDAPLAFAIADELEALLATAPDRDELARFYYRRLEHVRTIEGRDGERLRLWDRLGELSRQLGRHDDAVSSFEVALTLEPGDHARRQRLADLYLEAGPAHDASAILQHQAILRVDKRRVESYQALRTLYRRTGQPERAQACEEALTLLAGHVTDHILEHRIQELFEHSPTGPSRVRGDIRERPFDNDDWLAVARADVDPMLSTLFALVAPPFAVERARLRPPQPIPAKEHEPSKPVSRVLARIVNAFGLPRPPTYLDREQPAAGRVMLRARGGMLVSVLVLGRPTVEPLVDDHELAFVLARELADLRTDRLARLLCPRPGELAQIIELAWSLPGDTSSHAARWLATALHPVELDRALAIGGRLRARGIHPLSAARDWLAATERAADRIGLAITGDLATCIRVLERAREPSADRIVDLIAASVSEEMLGVLSPRGPR